YTNGAADPTINGYTPSLNPASAFIRGPWIQMYAAINDCNEVLEAAEQVNMDAQLKNIRIAELRFLRAHYFFLLVQTYGPISIPLTPTKSASSEAIRSPISEVYTVIIDDLKFAVANLPL